MNRPNINDYHPKSPHDLEWGDWHREYLEDVAKWNIKNGNHPMMGELTNLKAQISEKKNSINMAKKYRLRKDSLHLTGIIKKGIEVELDETGLRYIHKPSKFFFTKDVVESETEWFEEVIPKRINVIDFIEKSESKLIYQFQTSSKFPKEKIPFILRAIADVLNS